MERWTENRRRRADDRFPFEADVLIFAGREAPARMVDLSHGGAGLFSREAILPGTPIRLALVNNNIEVSGLVRGCLETSGENYRIGIAFESSQRDLVEVLIALELGGA